MSGLEVLLVLLPVLQLVQPAIHGFKEARRKRKEQKLQARLGRGGRQEPQLGREVVEFQGRRQESDSGRGVARFANAAPRGWEETRVEFAQEMRDSRREVMEFSYTALEGWEAVTVEIVKEMRDTRRQLVFILSVVVSLGCIVVHLAYALGHAQGENKMLKRLHMVVDESFSPSRSFEDAPRLQSTAVWTFGQFWSLLTMCGRVVLACFVTPTVYFFRGFRSVLVFPFKLALGYKSSRLATAMEAVMNTTTSTMSSTITLYPAVSKVAISLCQIVNVITTLLNYPANILYDVLFFFIGFLPMNPIYISAPPGCIHSLRHTHALCFHDALRTTGSGSL